MVVAFDIDDTLMAEADFVGSALREIAATLSSRFGEEPSAWLKAVDDSNAEATFDRFADMLAARGAATPSVSEMVQMYRDHKPERLPLAPGAAELLDWLEGQMIDIAVITDGRTGTQTAKLRALGLLGRLQPRNILISEATGHRKTEPQNFKALQAMYPGKTMVYIGDNPLKDFRFPKALGWVTIGARDASGRNTHPQDFAIDTPDYIINRLDEAISILSRRR